jgi:serine/threonine protein kinase
MMGISMVDRIEVFHSKNLLHRDIKPENFVIGMNHENNLMNLIDFGLARLYKNMQGLHIVMKEGNGLIGTARYASINAHIGRELSRRDDLESIGYTLIYFIKGKLPWQDVKGSCRKAKYQHIKEVKMNTSVEALCADIPECFSVYMNYVRNLNFAEAPSYKHLRGIFEDFLVKNNMKLDYEFDWIIKRRKEGNYDSAPRDEAGQLKVYQEPVDQENMPRNNNGSSMKMIGDGVKRKPIRMTDEGQE